MSFASSTLLHDEHMLLMKQSLMRGRCHQFHYTGVSFWV